MVIWNAEKLQMEKRREDRESRGGARERKRKRKRK